MLYCHLQHHNDTITKTQWITDAGIFTSHFICKGSKRVTQSLRVRGSWRQNRNCNILTPLLWPSTLCLSCCPDAGVHSAGCWLSLLHLISNFSGPQTPSRFQRAPSAGCGFPYHTRPSPSSTLRLTSVLTELCNSSTPTWSPTWSLKSNV